jgi:DNA repair ATPase RecN
MPKATKRAGAASADADVPVLSDQLAADELRVRFRELCERHAEIRQQIEELRRQETETARQIDRTAAQLQALEPDPSTEHARQVREYHESQSRAQAARHAREQELYAMGVEPDEVYIPRGAPIDEALAQRRLTDRPGVRRPR